MPVCIQVSIHARHCWRARHRCHRRAARNKPFQSTPAIAGGRDGSGAYVRGRLGGFNPRPPLLVGETAEPDEVPRGYWFQSTPAIAGGRDDQRKRGARHFQSFNPRPPLLAGETRQAPYREGLKMVSIHARHCWRARPHRSRRTGGDYRVSIHARHCWRARPCAACCASLRTKRFNPRPPLLAGETLHTDLRKRKPVFQSTPAIAGGRDHRYPLR